ncbi:NASP family CENP-A chaperone [Schizosaccharomyces japonicus yFS275]|uniref:NASP family CENP-A chaperone n=1 Tax=Schizosaccharomyces japonicus (strain yFS275 / FY16936) TaxID=402676 RepID=B6K743_SCHJY|nr:NASP family CENP-A chaperone [Schizosaccharomyces japonicus yFS275]EEB09347.1 NASP family CENP-A chaperone [Schizosaccharomyces japonicus yFS275]
METIDQLVVQGNKAFSQKHYEIAAEKYSDALEVLEQKNGPDNIENRNVLWLYGRTLFEIALSKSQVLGGGITPAIEEQQQKETDSGPTVVGSFAFTGDKLEDRVERDDAAEKANDVKESTATATSEAASSNGSEKTEAATAASPTPAAAVAAEDDFGLAWEVLDLCRVLQTRAVEQLDSKDEKSRLADVLDLLGEISLENESFEQAAQDLQEALLWKQQVLEANSTLLSEAHYKLALALEFTALEDGSGKKEALKHVEAAADIIQHVLDAKRAATSSKKGKEKEDPTLTSFQQMLDDLHQKAQDLQAEEKPDLEKELTTSAVAGSLLSAPRDQLQKLVADAIQNANDLGSLVKRKRPKTDDGEKGEKAKRAK